MTGPEVEKTGLSTWTKMCRNSTFLIYFFPYFFFPNTFDRGTEAVTYGIGCSVGWSCEFISASFGPLCGCFALTRVPYYPRLSQASVSSRKRSSN